jgi:hypothetical protein
MTPKPDCLLYLPIIYLFLYSSDSSMTWNKVYTKNLCCKTEVKTLMVECVQSNWNLVAGEIYRWKQLLEISRCVT